MQQFRDIKLTNGDTFHSIVKKIQTTNNSGGLSKNGQNYRLETSTTKPPWIRGPERSETIAKSSRKYRHSSLKGFKWSLKE